MNPQTVIQLGQEGLEVALLVSAPLLVISLAIGLLVSLFQVATSIQDVTLTFVPKILVVSVLLLLIGPWILGQIVDLTVRLIRGIPELMG